MSFFFAIFFLVIKLLCIFAVEKIEEVNHTNKKQIFKLYEKVSLCGDKSTNIC